MASSDTSPGPTGAPPPAPPPSISTRVTRQLGIRVPLIGGAMYPCSNAELVAAVSAAGGIGVVQPISLTYVHGHEFRAGLGLIGRLAGGRPIGLNAVVETSSRVYHQRMVRWVEIALEEGLRFFVTALGNPRWVVERVHAAGGLVYHDVTEARWARKGVDAGIDGLIAVNARAGGHAGRLDPEALLEDLAPFGLPVVCAGGVGDAAAFVAALRLGYDAVQLGTRLIATPECHAHERYKQAIVDATEDDIVLTERLTGVPVSVIRTPLVERLGTRAGPVARWLLRGRRTKHWMRTVYGLRAVGRLRTALSRGDPARDYWQAGKSVAGIGEVTPVSAIVERFARAARDAGL